MNREIEVETETAVAGPVGGETQRVAEPVDTYQDRNEVHAYINASRVGLFQHLERQFISEILRRFGHRSGLRVLDVGTGPGWIPIQLAKARPDWFVTAVDFSPLMLASARRSADAARANVSWVQGRAESLPFEDGSFDLVVSHFAFHEFPDPRGAWREMQRVTNGRAGAAILIRDLERPSRRRMPVARFGMRLYYLFSESMFKQITQSFKAAYTLPELRSLAAECGIGADVRTRWVTGLKLIEACAIEIKKIDTKGVLMQTLVGNKSTGIQPPEAPEKSSVFFSLLQRGGEMVRGFLHKNETDNFCRVLGGHIYFQTMSAAVQLDLFTLLSFHPGSTRKEIAARLGVDEKPIRILLLGLVSLDLIKKRGEYYTNSAIAEAKLTAGKRGTLIPVVKWQHFINYKALYHFTDAIRANTNTGLKEIPGTEPTLYEKLAHNPELEKVFQDAMQSISVMANDLLSGALDLSHVRHLVDVGGGNATNIMALARQFPSLRASVFDSPTVCAIARANIQRAGLSDRLDAVAGNCFDDSFPKTADCIFFGHFFTIWSEERNRSLLKKCFDSLPSGGSVIIFNMMQRDDESGPLTASMGSPYFLTLATGEGMLYTAKEYGDWMREAGFAKVHNVHLPNDHAAIIGTKV